MQWVRLHRLAFADAMRRLAAQPFGSAVSVLVLALAIALPVIAAVVLRSVGAVTAGLDTDPHVNVYLTLDADGEDAKRVERTLRANPDVTAVRFIPRAEALAELEASTHLAELLASLDRNPLPDAFTVRVSTTDAARIGAAKAEWSKLPKVDQVVADFEWSERLGRWVRLGEHVLLAIGVLLGLTVLFIVGHLIRLQVVTRRQEIEVSQLIGATAADVRRPFLYHGAFQGALAGVAAVALAAGMAVWLGSELLALTPQYAAELKVVFIEPWTCLALVAGAAGLGLAGAWLAVGRELRGFAGPR
jgi:cell division transport system permease protein